MNEIEVFEILKKQICKEISQIAEQVQKNGTMSTQDLEKLDKLYHTKKDMLATYGMEEVSNLENQNENRISGYRGRAANGRYMSMSDRSYADGYSNGYSEAMKNMSESNGYSEDMNSNGGNGWRYPMMPYGPRRW